MNTTALFPRKRILNALGFIQNASRSSWSHDDGQRIFFDAWVNRYAHSGKYPMSTADCYARPDSAGFVVVDGVREMARRGHTMWLAHLDLVLSRQRQPILINPVPNQPGPRQGDGGAKGWLPRYSTGRVIKDKSGYWFLAETIADIDLYGVVPWKSNGIISGGASSLTREADAAVKATRDLLERHIAESKELLAHITATPRSSLRGAKS